MSKIKSITKWISSTGGPLILMEDSSLPEWKGVFGSSHTNSDGTDYERACEIEDYVGLIDVGQNKGLVLGDEPTDTTWINVSSNEGIIVRWIWADNNDQIVAALNQTLHEQMWEETGIKIVFHSKCLILFDAGNSHEFIRDSLHIKLNPGKYYVENLVFRPNQKINLLLHRITKVT